MNNPLEVQAGEYVVTVDFDTAAVAYTRGGHTKTVLTYEDEAVIVALAKALRKAQQDVAVMHDALTDLLQAVAHEPTVPVNFLSWYREKASQALAAARDRRPAETEGRE